MYSFFKTFIRSPRETGAIFPSSPFLANTMASYAKRHKGVIVELGPGTGVITAALLKTDIHVDHIVVIESDLTMIKKLHARFPKLQIIHGNAANLSYLMRSEKRPIDTIISSLPLRSLPVQMTHKILQEINHALIGGGRYIQFTYHLF